MPVFVFYVFIALGLITLALGLRNGSTSAYRKGIESFNDRDYGKAVEELEKMAGYKDTDLYLDYARGKLHEQHEDFESAAECYASVGDFLDAPALALACDNEARYKAGTLAFSSGKLYEAYDKFSSLGDLRDSAERAAACIQPPPKSGVMFHENDYDSDDATLIINVLKDSDKDVVVKIYDTDGDVLAATAYVDRAKSVSIDLPEGKYMIKASFGDSEYWFGDEEYFGGLGYYCVLADANGSTTLTLEEGMENTVGIRAKANGENNMTGIDPSQF
jgi:tetratricopeptide (TPR) repeat protein